MKITDNEDVKMVFENLMKGSRNHIRSFYKQILSNGGSYIPQYISKSEFEKIVNSAMEKGAW